MIINSFLNTLRIRGINHFGKTRFDGDRFGTYIDLHRVIEYTYIHVIRGGRRWQN